MALLDFLKKPKGETVPFRGKNVVYEVYSEDGDTVKATIGKDGQVKDLWNTALLITCAYTRSTGKVIIEMDRNNDVRRLYSSDPKDKTFPASFPLNDSETNLLIGLANNYQG